MPNFPDLTQRSPQRKQFEPPTQHLSPIGTHANNHTVKLPAKPGSSPPLFLLQKCNKIVIYCIFATHFMAESCALSTFLYPSYIPLVSLLYPPYIPLVSLLYPSYISRSYSMYLLPLYPAPSHPLSAPSGASQSASWHENCSYYP